MKEAEQRYCQISAKTGRVYPKLPVFELSPRRVVEEIDRVANDLASGASARPGRSDRQWQTVQEDKQNKELLNLSNQILELTKAIHAITTQRSDGPRHPA